MPGFRVALDNYEIILRSPPHWLNQFVTVIDSSQSANNLIEPMNLGSSRRLV